MLERLLVLIGSSTISSIAILLVILIVPFFSLSTLFRLGHHSTCKVINPSNANAKLFITAGVLKD